MPSVTLLSAAASLAVGSLVAARPIPHTVSLFRRAILNANDGVLIVQNENAPKTYAANLEPYDQYHFRFMAIGCDDVDPQGQFYETCCQPRASDKQADASYPLACQLKTYLVFDPQYQNNQVVAKLGSLSKYQDKLGYSNQDNEAPAIVSADISTSQASSSVSSSSKEENTWTSSSSSSKPASSSNTWTPSSSSSQWTPSSSSQWTPSSSSQWSSSSENTWKPEPSSSSSPAPSPSPDAVWHAQGVQVQQVDTSSSQQWTSSSQQWTSSSQAPPTTPASSNNGGGDFTGTASWYTQNGNPGACGNYNPDSADIVAIKTDLYGWTGQKSQYCGRSLTITNTDTGATAQAIVADACPGCSSYYSLDLSTGLFQKLGSLDQGLLPIKWHWN